jgi:hypothetical protein
MTAANTPTSTPSSSSTPDPSTASDRRLLNPLAPPFMLFHPLQLAYPQTAAAAAAALQHSLLQQNRQQHSAPQDPSHHGVPVLQAWYPHPPHPTAASAASVTGPSMEHPQVPFPAIPPAPADFASPIPLGPMVTVQSLFGFPPTVSQGESNVTATGHHQGICWDPLVGMFRSGGNTVGLFEQMSANSTNEGVN